MNVLGFLAEENLLVARTCVSVIFSFAAGQLRSGVTIRVNMLRDLAAQDLLKALFRMDVPLRRGAKQNRFAVAAVGMLVLLACIGTDQISRSKAGGLMEMVFRNSTNLAEGIAAFVVGMLLFKAADEFLRRNVAFVSMHMLLFGRAQ